MSKLSVHISSGNRSGFTDWLDTCVAGGSPIGIIYSVNENIGDDLIKHSPTTQWVYRYQTSEFQRLPDGFLAGDPIENATEWMTQTRDSHHRTLIDNWRLNQADWHDPLNEPVPDIPAKANWLNTWMLTALEIAKNNGFKLALFSLTTGFTIDPACWAEMLPALRRGKELGAILSVHAYWEQLDPSTDTFNALRYRELYKILPADAQLPLVISEASAGNGYDTGKKGQIWVDDMAKYDGELMKDSYVLGACGYQLGGHESNLEEALTKYGTYIAQTPTPIDIVTPPPPADVIIPVIEPISDPTDEPTTTPTVSDPQPAVASGPLDFEVQTINCRKDASRSNGIIVTFQFTATGGSQPYTYVHENEVLAGPTFDRLATTNGKIIDMFRVNSADGQTQSKTLFFSPRDLNCG